MKSVYFYGGCRIRTAIDIVRPSIGSEYGQLSLRQAMQQHDAVWIALDRITAADIPESPRCRFIACPCTGLDHIDLEACQRAGIEVISLQGERQFLATVRATAEHTIALMLALLRQIPAACYSVAHGFWARELFAGRELHGKTVGIIGNGRVGQQVAAILQAFGCIVLTCDDGESLAVVLGCSDIVSLHVPLNEGTRHLIGEAEIAMMKPGAILVNTSRGGVVDEAALAKAIKGKRLGGCAVDVLDGEPDIDDSPLRKLARESYPVLITPHIGGNTNESREKTDLFIAQKLIRALEQDTCRAA